MELYPKKKQVIGFTGCNTYAGSIREVSPAEISFGAISQTKKACPDMDIEYAFMDGMKRTRAYRFKGLELTLLDNQGQPVLVFQKVD